MADQSWHSDTQTRPQAGSAVLNMDDGQSDASDYETNYSDETMHGSEMTTERGKGGPSMEENIKQKLSDNVTKMVWEAGTQSAKRAWSLYGNIDILRPYFDVEPKQVQMRLLYSLIPLKPTDQRIQVPKELYGPSMLVLTMIALLLYQMKTAEHKVEEGTLMGSAFAVCFAYWIGASVIVWFMCYVSNVRMALLQSLSMMGYALFGHCIVLFLGTVIHTSHDHMFFYLMWAVIGGLSVVRMGSIIMSRVRGSRERLIVIGTIATLHLLFLLYLHFAYHTIVEELSDTFSAKLVPAPVPDANLKPDLGQLPDKAIDQAIDVTAHAVVTPVLKESDHHQVVKRVVNGSVNTVVKVTEAAAKAGGVLLNRLKEVKGMNDH